MTASTLAFTLLFSATLWGQGTAPAMSSASPKSAKPGDTIEITGVNLTADKVDEVYLTDHKFDMKIKILEQTATRLKVRVPPFAKAGRVELLILTKGDDPKLLEEPVYVVIEESTTEVGQVTPPPSAPNGATGSGKKDQKQQ